MENFTPMPLHHQMNVVHLLSKVSDLIIQNPHSWNTPKMQTLFEQYLITEIQKNPIPPNSQRHDLLIWTLNHNGKFSVKTAYHIVAKNFGIPLQSFPSSLFKKY